MQASERPRHDLCTNLCCRFQAGSQVGESAMTRRPFLSTLSAALHRLLQRYRPQEAERPSAPPLSTRLSQEIDIVQEASEESFPASDAPSWTPISSAGPPR